jgi:hypothetical protein
VNPCASSAQASASLTWSSSVRVSTPSKYRTAAPDGSAASPAWNIASAFENSGFISVGWSP